jgi:hypothetical protein
LLDEWLDPLLYNSDTSTNFGSVEFSMTSFYKGSMYVYMFLIDFFKGMGTLKVEGE